MALSVILFFYRSSLVSRPAGPVAAEGKLRNEQLDLFTSLSCWRKKKTHLKRKKVMWQQKTKSMAHRETEVKCLFNNFSNSSHSLQWTFCKCLISTVFDLALFLRKKMITINLCIWRWHDEKKKSYCMTSLASPMCPLFQLTCELWYWRTKPIMYHL